MSHAQGCPKVRTKVEVHPHPCTTRCCSCNKTHKEAEAEAEAEASPLTDDACLAENEEEVKLEQRPFHLVNRELL